MRSINDAIEFLIVLIGIIAVVSGAIELANLYCEYQCKNYKEITGKNTKYVKFDTCYVETEKGFQRWDEYIHRAIASEGLKNK